MKYIKPFNETDPNAGYVNGDPSASIQGSIPPAEAFEHPLRELDRAIGDSGQTQSSGNLAQLSAAIRRPLFSVDTGTVNSVVLTIPNWVHTEGRTVKARIGAGNTNTGAANVTIAPENAKPLTYPDGSSIIQGELPAGRVCEMLTTATGFVLVTPAIKITQSIYNSFYTIPGTYWRLDSPSNSVIANAQVFMANYGNKTATVGAGTVVDQTNGWVIIGPNDGGTYVLTASGAIDQPTTEEQVVIWYKPGNAGPGIALTIARNPYPAPGNNANDASVSAIARLAPGDSCFATYYQTNPNNSTFNMLNQPLSHFGGVRVAG
ncbi:hypothetical protein [Methylobacterium oryzisoli]|uniref:hypothetical protein n=1 Tax=Methylobacterium oryzisoli TaxID=3385502 RepID=UPI00389249B3